MCLLPTVAAQRDEAACHMHESAKKQDLGNIDTRRPGEVPDSEIFGDFSYLINHLACESHANGRLHRKAACSKRMLSCWVGDAASSNQF
jgi:hypothetical protein